MNQLGKDSVKELAEREHAINHENTWNLFEKSVRPAETGDSNRVKLQFTITPETADQWRDFIETYSGQAPRRGRGIGSALVELSMHIFMGAVADFKLKQTAYEIKRIMHKNALVNLRQNLLKLASLLE
jgi:hypothetical protein